MMRKKQLLRIPSRITLSKVFDSPRRTKNLRTGCCGSKKKSTRCGSSISVATWSFSAANDVAIYPNTNIKMLASQHRSVCASQALVEAHRECSILLHKWRRTSAEV